MLTCHILILLCLDTFHVSLISSRPLLWRGVEFCERLCEHLMRWSHRFFHSFYLGDGFHWQIFIYWTILTSLGWSQLDHGEFLTCSWIWFCQYLLNFYINIHEEYWSILVFLSWLLMCFVYQSNYSLIKRVWQCPFSFDCVEQFEDYWG